MPRDGVVEGWAGIIAQLVIDDDQVLTDWFVNQTELPVEKLASILIRSGALIKEKTEDEPEFDWTSRRAKEFYNFIVVQRDNSALAEDAQRRLDEYINRLELAYPMLARK